MSTILMIVVALLAPSGVIVTILQVIRRENNRDHASNSIKLDRLDQKLDRHDTKLDRHADTLDKLRQWTADHEKRHDAN